MFCRQCGKQIDELSLRCHYCGAPVLQQQPTESTQQHAVYSQQKQPLPNVYQPGHNPIHQQKTPFYKRRWFIVSTVLFLLLSTIITSYLSQHTKTKSSEPDTIIAESRNTKIYGTDEDNLTIGQAAQYSNYELTLVSVEAYAGGDRALFEIEALGSSTIKRNWFEGTSSQHKNLNVDKSSDSLEESLPEKIKMSKGDIATGYIYFSGGGLSSIRFSGGVFSSDRTWNFEQNEDHSINQNAQNYATALERFGFSAEEAESIRSLFSEAGIEGCDIDRTEALLGTGIDELQSFRTWIDIDPMDPIDFHGSSFQHQINFTFENRQIFFIEITSFNIMGINEDMNYILYDTEQGGLIARYDPATDSVTPL